MVRAKQALQSALLLGVCFWLLYQIGHSNSDGKDYGGRKQSNLNEQHVAIVLGRKGDAGWSNLVTEDKGKEDGGDGDDELDAHVDEEAFRKENEESRSDVEVSKTGEAVDFDKHLVAGFHSKTGDDNGVERDDKNPGTQVKEPEKNKEMDDEGEEDREITEREQENAAQPTVVENNASIVDGNETLDAFHSFHDVTGIPPDGNELAEPILTESMDDHPNILHQETDTDSNNHSRFSESSIIEEAVSREQMLPAHGETKNKSSLEEPENHARDDIEINSHSFS